MRILCFLLFLFALPAVPAHAQPAEADIAVLREAFALAQDGPSTRYQQAEKRLRDHPMHPWLEYVHLSRDLANVAGKADDAFRSEERRVGTECVSPGRSRWSLYH